MVTPGVTRANVQALERQLQRLEQHIVDSRRVDRHLVETLSRKLLTVTSEENQHVMACALIRALCQELRLVDQDRPGLPMR